MHKTVKGAKTKKSCPTIGHLGEITRLLVAYKLVSSFIEKLESDKTDLLYFTNVSSGCMSRVNTVSICGEFGLGFVKNILKGTLSKI